MFVKVYRQKIFSVQAVQVLPESVAEAASWCGGLSVIEKDPFDESRETVGINVPTLEGVKRASQGDYILRHWSGGFEILQATEFDDKYERPTRG